MSVMGVLLGGAAVPQEAPVPPPSPLPSPSEPPAPQEPGEPPATADDNRLFEEQKIGPAAGVPTVSLAQAVSLALERNFGLLQTADSLAASRFRETAAVAAFHPKLTPSYARGGGDDQTIKLDASQRLPWTGGSVSASARLQSFPGVDTSLSHSSVLSLTLSQPLLRGIGPTATYFELKNSRRAREGQERSYELSRQRLAVDVVAAFYQVVKQRQLLAVARQSDERSRKLRGASEARMRVGLASKLDVLRADLQASQAQEAMVSFEAALETALETFRVLLGLSPTETVEPEAVALADRIEGEVEPLEVLLARAHAQRLEMLETEDLLRDSQRAAAVARQGLWPQLDLQLSLNQFAFGSSFQDAFSAFRSANRTVLFGFTTSYPLERAGERAQKAVAELDVDAKRRGLQQREYEIEAEVRAAVRNIERIQKSVELQRKGVAFAEQQHRLATLRYQRGLASNFDVVDAEGSLVASRTALVGLLTDYQVARIQLQKATGTLDVAREFGP